MSKIGGALRRSFSASHRCAASPPRTLITDRRGQSSWVRPTASAPAGPAPRPPTASQQNPAPAPPHLPHSQSFLPILPPVQLSLLGAKIWGDGPLTANPPIDICWSRPASAQRAILRCSAHRPAVVEGHGLSAGRPGAPPQPQAAVPQQSAQPWQRRADRVLCRLAPGVQAVCAPGGWRIAAPRVISRCSSTSGWGSCATARPPL